MTTGVTREYVMGFYDARIAHDAARIGRYLDDDVDWLIIGPVDLLNFCGQRHGKSAVIDTLVRVGPALMRPTRMALQELLIDGDRVATLVLLSGLLTRNGRTLSYRSAQFMRFSDGKIIEFRGLIDSFDAAEQVLGHPIELAEAQDRGLNVVAV